MSDIVTKSEELFKLYEELDDTGEDLEPEGPTGQKSLEAIYALSQWQLIWRKFIRNKVAILGGIVILLYYLGGLYTVHQVYSYASSARALLQRWKAAAVCLRP
jgi:hypothetical protein